MLRDSGSWCEDEVRAGVACVLGMKNKDHGARVSPSCPEASRTVMACAGVQSRELLSLVVRIITNHILLRRNKYGWGKWGFGADL